MSNDTLCMYVCGELQATEGGLAGLGLTRQTSEGLVLLGLDE